MPVFLQPHPFEFRTFYNVNKEVAKRQMKKHAVSGYIGTPQGDSETFDKINELLDSLDTQLASYYPSVNEAFSNDFTTDPFNPNKLYNTLENVKKQVAKKTFKLTALPQDDIDTILGHIDTLTNFKNIVENDMDTIVEMINRPAPNNLDPDTAKATNDILTNIRFDVGEIITTLRTKITAYNSGSTQNPELVGGYNLDKPLRYCSMYQGNPTI
jgi:hypothetical protein